METFFFGSVFWLVVVADLWGCVALTTLRYEMAGFGEFWNIAEHARQLFRYARVSTTDQALSWGLHGVHHDSDPTPPFLGPIHHERGPRSNRRTTIQTLCWRRNRTKSNKLIAAG